MQKRAFRYTQYCPRGHDSWGLTIFRRWIRSDAHYSQISMVYISRLCKLLSTSTITRRFNAGVEKKRLSASLIVSHDHVNQATKGLNCGTSRCHALQAWSCMITPFCPSSRSKDEASHGALALNVLLHERRKRRSAVQSSRGQQGILENWIEQSGTMHRV